MAYTPNKNNRLAKTNNRLNEVTEELIEIENENEVHTTLVVNGTEVDEFNHEEWLIQEANSLAEERQNLLKVTNLSGSIEYDD